MKFMHSQHSPLRVSAFTRSDVKMSYSNRYCCHSNTCRPVSVQFSLFSSITQEVEGFGAIDSTSMLTKAARVHKVYDLLAVTLQNDKLPIFAKTTIHPALMQTCAQTVKTPLNDVHACIQAL